MPSPPLLQRIDEKTRTDHHWLGSEDHCVYLREYTSHVGYQHSETNDLISNLKKEMDRKGRPEWRWKQWAIGRCIDELRRALPEGALDGVTVVPMPPSSVASDPMYDDRMQQIARALCHKEGDYRELLLMRESMTPSHVATRRKRPEELEELLYVNEAESDPEPSRILVLDDVLTTGAHIVAAKRVLMRRFPNASVSGLFVARRVFPEQASGDSEDVAL